MMFVWQSCVIEEDDDEGAEEVKSFQEQEMEKQKLLYEQNRLANRGAAETVLLYISASKGMFLMNTFLSKLNATICRRKQ